MNERLSRREWLALTAAGLSIPLVRAGALAPAGDDVGSVAERVAKVIREFEAQGYHRTATAVDRASGEWLADQVRQAGLTPTLEPFALSRVDLVANAITIGDRRVDGIPLFDGAFTDATGIRGRFGTVASGAEIALSETPVNAAGAGPLGEARRSRQHRAIVAITRGRRPGLCPSNADRFREPFGPPVLQVSSEESVWLHDQAARGSDAQVVAHVARTSTTASNVTASITGRQSGLPPFIVMTPRSGWYWCASERGGGLACWLEIMRALRTAWLPRTIHFVATSGHELGYLGIDAFIDRRPDIVPRAIGWLHLGANIGAAVDPGITLQASHDDLDTALTNALVASGLSVTQRRPRGRVPGGEAEAVHRGGGRYVSVIGGNGLFHNLEDRGPAAVDPVAIAKFSTAFTALVRGMASVT